MVVIDTVSRLAIVRGLYSKTGHEVGDKLLSIISEIRQLQNPLVKQNEILMFTDFGSEFISHYTQSQLKQANVYLYIVGGEHKAGLGKVHKWHSMFNSTIFLDLV